MLYVLIIVTTVYSGDVANIYQQAFTSEESCRAMGTRWVEAAKRENVRAARFVCVQR